MTNLTRNCQTLYSIHSSVSETLFHKFQEQINVAWSKLLKDQKLRFYIFLFVFYVLPYLFAAFSQWDIIYSHILVASFFVVMILLAIRSQKNHHQIGFRLDTLKPAFLEFGIATLLLVVLTLLASNFQWLRLAPHPENPDWASVLAVYWLILVPFQEFGYRGLLFAKIKQMGIHNPWAQVFIVSVAFAIGHIHFHDWTTLMLTFSVSILWSWLYIRHPNWLVVTLAHGIVGSVALFVHIV